MDWPYWQENTASWEVRSGSKHDAITYTLVEEERGLIHQFQVGNSAGDPPDGPNNRPLQYAPLAIGTSETLLVGEEDQSATMSNPGTYRIYYINPDCASSAGDDVVDHISYMEMDPSVLWCQRPPTQQTHLAVSCDAPSTHDFLVAPTAITVEYPFQNDSYSHAGRPWTCFLSGAMAPTVDFADFSWLPRTYFPPNHQPGHLVLQGYPWSATNVVSPTSHTYEGVGTPTGMRHFGLSFVCLPITFGPGDTIPEHITAGTGDPSKASTGYWYWTPTLQWPSSMAPPSAFRVFARAYGRSYDGYDVSEVRAVLVVEGRGPSKYDTFRTETTIHTASGPSLDIPGTTYSPTWPSATEVSGAFLVYVRAEMHIVGWGVDEWVPIDYSELSFNDHVLVVSVDPGSWPLHLPAAPVTGSALVPCHLAGEWPYDPPTS